MVGGPDLNRGPSAPKADALPSCATPRTFRCYHGRLRRIKRSNRRMRVSARRPHGITIRPTSKQSIACRSVPEGGGMSNFYDEWLRYWDESVTERKHARKVIHEEEIQWVTNRQDAKVGLLVAPETGFKTWGR